MKRSKFSEEQIVYAIMPPTTSPGFALIHSEPLRARSGSTRIQMLPSKPLPVLGARTRS